LRILLISPTALDREGKPIRKRQVYLPGLTLPMLAAVTPPDCDVTLHHDTLREVPYDDGWDLVGVTGMGNGILRGWQIADEFRGRGVPVVMGGIAASLAGPELPLQHVDSVVIGEAEEVWPGVVRDAAAGRLQSVYRAERQPPIDSLPCPRYELLRKRDHGFFRPVQATRGCPFKCNFCSVTKFFQGHYRKAPVEHVIRDVRAAKRGGFRHIAFIDDNIAVDFDYSARLWEALIPEKITWISQCSIHIADHPEMLDLAHRSGCRLLSVGVESDDEASLEALNKSWNRPSRYTEAIARVRDHGIDFSTEMIVGADGDDDRFFEKAFRFIMDQRITVPRIHILTPVPGTPIWDEMEEAGRITSRDYKLFSGSEVIFEPRNFDQSTLSRGFWQLSEQVFSWTSIRRRMAALPEGFGVLMRGFVLGANLQYRRHVQQRISPGIV
jgi:radical SAM superfamily enzyme YgiQ (UPF0313 family)